MKKTRILFLSVVLYLVGGAAEALAQQVQKESSTTYKLYFKKNKTAVDYSYKDNGATVFNMVDYLKRILEQDNVSIENIHIISSTSPEGTSALNRYIATQRAFNTRRMLLDIFPELKDKNITVQNFNKNWNDVQNAAQSNQNINRTQILESFRSSSITITVITTEETEVTFIPTETPLKQDTIVPAAEKTDIRENPAPVSKKTIFALRSNLLLPAANVGVEVPVGNKWSVGADYYFPWVKRESNNKDCTQALMWNLEGRYWFGKERTEADLLKGHSMGLNAMFGYYDFERDYKGHQGEFANISLDYTYALPAFKEKIHFEFTIGVGYFFTQAEKYDVFEEGGKGYKKGYKENTSWVGPNKIGVSVVVPIKSTRRSK
ncbi:MAG: DUF3575 domain-containing protein [Bacteroidales bacterium]|nr:DUF3575 domain-containing protein [Bacteroidales bacterium]